MAVLDELKAAIVDGDIDAAAALAEQAIEKGMAPVEIIGSAVVPAIKKVGELWTQGRYFVPEVVMSAEAFKEAARIVRPHLGTGEMVSSGKVLIGTVQGDMHDLGKNIVAAMLEGAGFEVIDLGVDVATDTFIWKVREMEPNILGIGAYMSVTMLTIRDVISALESSGLRKKVKVMVGGIPVTPKFADEVGADAYGRDAVDAVAKARGLVKERFDGSNT